MENRMYSIVIPKTYDKIWYREVYLKSDYWLELRERLYKEVNNICEECTQSGIGLQVHHLSYKNLGKELRSDLVVICKFCHSKYHPQYKPSKAEWDIKRAEAKKRAEFKKRMRRVRFKFGWQKKEAQKAKQKERYHSAEQVEKRRLATIERQKTREKDRLEREELNKRLDDERPTMSFISFTAEETKAWNKRAREDHKKTKNRHNRRVWDKYI
jgi:hypothetical protein